VDKIILVLTDNPFKIDIQDSDTIDVNEPIIPKKSLLDNSLSLRPSHGGDYEYKYRKYKTLYLQLKEQIDNSLEEWGYHLQDLQINDITFDQVVMESMSKVVASNNLKAAAENEGQALLITKTKAAEAEGNSIKISAQAEKEAAQLRGQGVALFRQEVAKGMTEAAEEMKQANLDTNVILFSMWTEAIKNFAEYGKGNVIFLDGSPEGMDKTMKQMMGLITKKENMQDTIN
jgi:regulator of protease activity HflC (stomatin/prohibitin superfamily)